MVHVVAELARVAVVVHGPPAPAVLYCTRMPVTAVPFAGELFVHATETVVVVVPVTCSAVGASEQFGYGILDVKVTVSGTRITDVSVPTLEVAEYTSQQISAQAIALLRSEVLTAQSARIDAVSGATFTSEAYAASLQAALDALHMK